jgi:hypothetical protein
VHVAGDEDPPVDVLLLLRPLLRHLGDDPLPHVAVELVECDVTVLVQVGRAAADGLHQVPGEHRGRARPAQGVPLERVLGGVGRGEHRATFALEPLEGLHTFVGLGAASGREGAAVAAVEDQHLAT